MSRGQPTQLFVFCCAGSSLPGVGFSLVAASRAYCLVVVCELLTAVASLCCGAGLPGVRASVIVAHGLSCMGHLPGSGIKPVSPASAGRVLTTGPPGKSSHQLLKSGDFPCRSTSPASHERFMLKWQGCPPCWAAGGQGRAAWLPPSIMAASGCFTL